MGTDKALVQVDGVPMLARMVQTLTAAGLAPVVQVGGGPRGGVDVPVIPDALHGAGPVGGLLAALRWSPSPSVVVVACDLPHLNADAVQLLVRSAGESQAAVAAAYTGRWEPLCAVWDVAASLPVVEAQVAAGERALHRLLHALGALAVELPECWLHNVNAPEDLGRR
jgi:molybdopterin-guanine dinucleotide biosynthesis protein A